MKPLTELMLDILFGATSQAPMPAGAMSREIQKRQPNRHSVMDVLGALDQIVEERRAGTCYIQHAEGDGESVYWPIGLKTPALNGIKPKEPLIVPTQEKAQETLSSKLIKAIVAHGPLLAEDLAEKSGVSKNNIGGNIAHAIKTGSITTRKAYVAERGREMTHYMTTTQAQEWDDGARMETDMAQKTPLAREAAASVALDGDTHYADDATLARLRQLEEDNQALAAERDALLVRRPSATPTQAIGRMALLLIDSADLTEVEELDKHDAPNARALAVRSIEQGHAARAVVVRILGEARRQVEWKEAA